MNLVFTYLLILQAQHYLSELWWLPMPCFYLCSSKVQGSCMCCPLLSGLKGQGINHQPQAPCSLLLWWRCGQCSYHWKGTTQTQPLHLYTVCMEWQTTGEIFTLCTYQPRSLVSSYISILIFILYIHGNSAHLVKWITKNNWLVNIINDHKLQVLFVEIRASSLLFYKYFSHILPYFPFIFDYWLRSCAILFGLFCYYGLIFLPEAEMYIDHLFTFL